MTATVLDLFCGAGGATRGYQLAGFHVTGVDHAPQPHYGGERFVQADALEYLAAHGQEYEVIHASPPCQGYSRLRHLPWLKDKSYPLLIAPLLTLLRPLAATWVLENVEDAPLDGLVLCGQMFGLPLYRHRRFASNQLLLSPDHAAHTVVICGGRRTLARRYRRGGRRDVTGTFAGIPASEAMGIDWMTRAELSQAIPPAYTHWIGTQLLHALQRRRAGP